MRWFILSFGGVGFLRPAPGTWGSLAAVIAAWPLHYIGGPYALGAAAVLFYFVGLEAVKVEIASAGDHDPSWVVIDEAVGQWLALIPVSAGAIVAGVPFWNLWPGILSAFLLFRIFDVWKPWLVGRADRRGDATGVMMDDVWAGVFAAIFVMILAAVAHAGFVAGMPDQP